MDEECRNQFSDIESTLTVVKRSLSALKGSITGVKKILNKQSVQISSIEKKVYNGFGAAIESVDKKVDLMDARNQSDHKDIRHEVRSTRGLLFTMLVLIVVGFVTSSLLQRNNIIQATKRLENVTSVDTKIQVP